MPVIELTTAIHAPRERCFDLARSIDFHTVTAGKTRETAIKGRTTGLIRAGEMVTWRAKHLGVWQELTVELTAFDRPRHFQDVMRKGAFAVMQHDHSFEGNNGSTLMRDTFIFRSPLGPLGSLVDWLLLERYLRRFLVERARMLKVTAESEAWRLYVENPADV
ncbi:MAG TPA: SRPBCC family protein [Gemmatimonadaceae bacterium]|jgi:ligand-binding SRPBCC domain-containing protein|nr:SRPBCC family protein [Gemmatimonadaceae bacterium]